MISPLVINIRCVCIEEFVEMKKIHETYKRQKIEGEITSAYVGADRKLYGFDKNLDKMLDKVYSNDARLIITGRIAKEEEKPCVEEPVLDQMREEGKEEYTFRPESAQEAPAVEARPKITLTDVMTAMAEEPDLMEAIKTEAEGEPDGDEQAYNATYAG